MKRAGERLNGEGGSAGQSHTLVRERKEESQPTQAATRRRLYLHDKDLLVKVLEVRWHQCFVRGLRRGHQVFLHTHVVNKALNTVLTTRDGSFRFALASGVRLQHTFLVPWVISRKKSFGTLTER